jgi:hypothetical protein
MMLAWFPHAFIVVMAFLLFSAIYPRWLYFSIPAVLFFSIYSYILVGQLLGYPTADISDLHKRHIYMAHWGTGPAFYVAIPSGATAPRLYFIDELSGEEEENMETAKERAGQGIMQEGQFFEGEYRRYDMDPEKAMGPKK